MPDSQETERWSASATLACLSEELGEGKESTAKDILSCGADNLHDLLVATKRLSNDDTRQASMDKIADLIALVHRCMSSTSSSFCWRRLYTDACLIWSLAYIAYSSVPEQSMILQCINMLDRAIIVAGAPGEGRLDLVLLCIQNIQTTYLPLQSFERATPRPSSLLSACSVETSSGTIPFIQPPSFASFKHLHSHGPFILRGYIQHWPSASERPWASDAYLRSVAGHGRIIPIEVGKDYRRDDWTQKMMNWDDFLTSVDSEGGEVVYLAQHDIMRQFPALRNDIIVPDYVYAALPPPESFPQYKPPANDEELVINAWFGPAGTESPAHTDPFFNLYAQVVGRKTVWLGPPSVTGYMYAYPPAEENSHHNPAANTTEPSMSNTSQVDVFASRENGIQKHPEFWENAVPHALSATLQPGDLLFFPPGWWHAMRSEEKSFSVSMWF